MWSMSTTEPAKSERTEQSSLIEKKQVEEPDYGGFHWQQESSRDVATVVINLLMTCLPWLVGAVILIGW